MAADPFEFASDVTKQLITLATGVVTLTVSFSSDVLSLAAGNGRGILTASWIVFLASVLAGIVTLMALTGHLGAGAGGTIYSGNVRILSVTQIVLFLGGIGLIVWYLLFALG